ncbi:MAG: RDD family protein [Deltaproteobacteria bacterium]|nr:RDD family protein [Deltaproteobacteria bacterium]
MDHAAAYSGKSTQRADMKPRTAAALVDVIIIFGLAFLLGPLVGFWISYLTEPMLTYGEREALAELSLWPMQTTLPLLFPLYFFTEALWGATPGKRLVGLVVAHQDGGPAAPAQLTSRFLLKSMAFLLALASSWTGWSMFSLMEMLAAMILLMGFPLSLGVDRQALHDRLTHTAVYFTE